MIIGITGSLGTGKTTVARMFASKGAKVLDADRISHLALRKGGLTYKSIISYFGKAILNRDSAINKKRLAAIVFNNKKKLRRLNKIVHPFVIKKIKASINQAASKDIVVIDAPLLIEAALADVVDKLVVVKADGKTQLLRCMKKRGLKKEEAIKRIENQLPLSKKIDMADYVVDNNGSLKKTRRQVNNIWREIKWI